jgi:hypothetical protein
MSGRIILSTGRRLGKKITATGTSKQVREGGGVPLPDTYMATHHRQEVGSHFFAFFRFKFFTSLRFSNFCFEAKRNSSLFFPFFRFFFTFFDFFAFFAYFSLFSLNFCFTSIFSPNFRLFYLCFRFRFLVFRIEVNHVKSGFFSLPRETKFSLQFQISLPKRK